MMLEDRALVYANPYARRLLRLDTHEQRLPDAEWATLLTEDQESAHQEDVATGRYRTVTFASGKSARWWVIPHHPADVVFILDVTTQQRTEQAGRTLVNDLSHELRTPIATMLTHLEILGLDDVDPAARRQSLALAKEETRRMARLVDDMLELGRLEMTSEMECRPLDLLKLVEDVILHVTPRAAEANMTLSVEADTPLSSVIGHADRLRQVFLNLLDNALKYARTGDAITISLQQTDTGVRCAVCDNGPGIPARHLPHLTQRFYRATPSSIEGSGLGLALVAEILRRHESKLTIESHTEGETGTCVRFVLPTLEA
jgi:two-component system phosphate regulon sensor histidine kinase PhoR